MPDVLDQLVSMSNHLGRPELEYAILGEGNTSARLEDGTFWVTASGMELRSVDASGFVRVSSERLRAARSAMHPGDDQIREILEGARVEPGPGRRPSVEAFMHAGLLELEGVNFVGHTHPIAVNAITCSRAFDQAVYGRLFPDEIVLCGPESVVVPYVDPGLPLAREIHRRVDKHFRARGERPRVVLLQNHGLIALGATAREVEDITAMAVKAARILAGTFALGGPRFLDAPDVRRIHRRPDEHYRQKVIGERERHEGTEARRHEGGRERAES